MNGVSSKLKLSFSMFVFGTIGIFVKYISFPSSVICMFRGFIGAFFLLLIFLIKKQKISFGVIKKNALLLLISGASLGFNWVLLFESYKYTSVATATLCYYMAPIIVIAFSPFLFKERITTKKAFCVVMSLAGMVLVTDIFSQSLLSSQITGVALGLSSALIYALLIVCNKKLVSISVYERTIIQLFVCGTVMLVYSFFTKDISGIIPTVRSILLMAFVCIFHTGLTYLLFFGSMEKLSAQTIAVISYIDPAVAVVVSALVLKENITIGGIIGAVLIIGSAVLS